MKRIIALIAIALCAGCSTTSFQRGDIKFTNTRTFWTTSDLTASLPMEGGLMTIGLKSSSTDSAAILAMAQGFAMGMAAYQGRAPATLTPTPQAYAAPLIFGPVPPPSNAIPTP